MVTPVASTSQTAPVATAGLKAAATGMDKQAALEAALQVLKSISSEPIDSPAIERLATLILASGKTGEDLMAKLADLVGGQLGISRQDGELTDAFFARIATAIEKLPLQQRLVVEFRTGLKNAGIPLDDVARALRDPASPLAARIAAQMEVPQATRPAPDTSVTQSYLDDGAGPNQGTETNQARMAAKASSAGQTLFNAPLAAKLIAQLPDTDVAVLQSRLVAAFAEKEQSAVRRTQPNLNPAITTILGGEIDLLPGETLGRPDGLPTRAFSTISGLIDPKVAIDIRSLAESLHANADQNGRTVALGERLKAGLAALVADLRAQVAAAMPVDAEPALAGAPGLANRTGRASNAGDNRQPTMMILRGLTEVVTQIADRTAETLRTVMDLPAETKPATRSALAQALLAPFQMPASAETGDAAPVPGKAAELKAMALPLADQPVTPMIDDEAAARTLRTAIADQQGLSDNPAATAESREAARMAQAGADPVPVPFAFVPYPIEDDEGAAKRRRATLKDGEEEAGDEPRQNDGEDGETGDQPARKPRSEWDDIGDEPEDLPPLGRSASDADRAFRHYQRMRGF